jgi:hypothetical protein
MRVLDACDGVLTNFEVAQLLTAQQQRRDEEEAALPLPGARRSTAGTSAWSSQQTVAVLSEQVLTYLEKGGCTSQTHDGISTFLEGVKPFKLTRTETLALVNTPPSSVVEIHLLVEECEERLTPDDVRELLKLCQRTVAIAKEGGEVDDEGR